MNKFIAVLVALPLAVTVIAQSPAQAKNPPIEENHPTCVSAPASPENFGDDICTLPAGSFTELTGKFFPEVDVLLNDTGDTPGISGLVADKDGVVLDPAIGVFSRLEDSTGYNDLGLWIEPSVTQPFKVAYRGTDGLVRTITVNPTPYVPPVMPEQLKPAKVTKAKRHGRVLKGYLRVCAPASGPDLVFLHGSYDNPDALYDGYAFVKHGTCPIVRVYRTAIDWEAYQQNTRLSVFAGAGHIDRIKLPKKGKRSMHSSARYSAKAPFGGHWGPVGH